MPRRAKGVDGLTEQQRQFRDKYLQTRNATQAYKYAYSAQRMSDATIRKEAHKLLKNPNIARTLAAKQETAQLKHDITVDTLTQKLQAALDKAMAEQRGASAAVSAIMAMGKLHGLIVDKRKEVPRVRSAAEIDAKFRALLAADESERDGLKPGDNRMTVTGYGNA